MQVGQSYIPPEILKEIAKQIKKPRRFLLFALLCRRTRDIAREVSGVMKLKFSKTLTLYDGKGKTLETRLPNGAYHGLRERHIGCKVTSTNYDNGKKHGIETTVDKGKLITCHYINGVKDGISSTLVGDVLMGLTFYKSGGITDKTTYFADGKIYRQDTYTGDMRRSKTFYSNGKVSMELIEKRTGDRDRKGNYLYKAVEKNRWTREGKAYKANTKLYPTA